MSEVTANRAAIITIGTEVTSGQIVNTNAAWLSDQLGNHKIPIEMHLSVQDIESQIISALDYASQHCELLFVTGGLGPTRDDLTRDAISKWLGQKLIFDETSWQRIIDRLTKFGIPVAESNRQQCYFPAQAKILVNEVGTANAFFIEQEQSKLWCLPGPPREIKRIWQDHVSGQLVDLGKNQERWNLHRWHCLGKSESALGEIVETVIAGTRLISGYRPHIPYVEVKLWCPEKLESEYQTIFQDLETALADWLIGKDEEDLATRFLAYCQHVACNIQIYDSGSFGLLTERLGAARRKLSNSLFKGQITVHDSWSADTEREAWAENVLDKCPDQDLCFWVTGLAEDGSWLLGWQFQGRSQQIREELPYKGQDQERMERYRRFLTEKTIYQWLRAFTENKAGSL